MLIFIIYYIYLSITSFFCFYLLLYFYTIDFKKKIKKKRKLSVDFSPISLIRIKFLRKKI